MDIVIYAAIPVMLATLCGLLGIALGRHVWPTSRRVDAAALIAAQAALSAAQSDAARLDGRVVELQHGLDGQKALLHAAEIERRGAEAGKAAAEARLGDRENFQTQLTTEFENIADRILKARSSELSQGSQKELGAILEPLRQRIQDFQSKVETTYQSETRDVLSLKAQIELLVQRSEALGSQADGLAKAMRGDSQVLGQWGDLKLERILEMAGLTEGRDYIRQGQGLNLRDEEGNLQRPDIIVMLPKKHTMIIDSKVSLVNYERFGKTDDQEAKDRLGKQLVRDVKAHIDGLSGKRYQDNEKLVAHDYVLMFVPIESALAASLAVEPELFSHAWQRHVVLVGQSTLIMTMYTVASIQRSERQAENTLEIARLAGALLDKISLSLADLNIASEKLADAANAHNEAIKKLSTGRGNALSIGASIRRLGIKSKHKMYAALVDGTTFGEPDDVDGEIPVLLPGPEPADQEAPAPASAE